MLKNGCCHDRCKFRNLHAFMRKELSSLSEKCGVTCFVGVTLNACMNEKCVILMEGT